MITHFKNIPLKDIVLVRVLPPGAGLNFEEDGVRIYKSREDSRSNTAHFSVNGVVSNHAYGKFDGEIVVMVHLTDLIKLGHKPSGFRAEDVWFHYDKNGAINLGNRVQIVAPFSMKFDNAKLGESKDGQDSRNDQGLERNNVITRYKLSSPQVLNMQTRNEVSENVLASMGVTVKKIGMWNWVGSDVVNDYSPDFPSALGLKELNINSHSNSLEEEILICERKIEALTHDYDSGETVTADANGAETTLIAKCEELYAQMETACQKHKKQIGCNKAEVYHDKKMMSSSKKIGDVVAHEMGRKTDNSIVAGLYVNPSLSTAQELGIDLSIEIASGGKDSIISAPELTARQVRSSYERVSIKATNYPSGPKITPSLNSGKGGIVNRIYKLRQAMATNNGVFGGLTNISFNNLSDNLLKERISSNIKTK